jgi:anaerobic magnesium-protoporphyrin IX monomethyl ester cyclase
MSKIALVCVPSMENAYHTLQDFVAILPPSSILTIASCLEKAGHEVLFIDSDGMGLTFEQVLSKVISFDPDYVGITAMTATITIAAQLCKRVKEANPKIITIFGGIHATALPVRTIEDYPFVDYVVKGEGEYTLVKLLERLNAGCSPDDIESITFRKGGSIIDNARVEPIRNLDELPLPAHHLLNYSRYRSYGWNGWDSGKRAPVGAVYTARGCYRSCTFCSSKVVLGRGIRCFGVDRVMEEIDLLVKKYKIRILYIQDDTFAAQKQRSMEICELILKRGYKLEIMIAARCDEVDLELYKKLKEAGVNWCCYGVESGNQGVLDSIKKGIKLDNVYKAFETANRVGFHVGGNFMIGFPNETWDTAMDTINLACKLPMDYASFAICIPFPGTDMYYDAIQRKIPMPPWSGFGLVNSPPIPLSGLSVAELYRLRRIATFKFFTNPRYLLRLMMKFKRRGVVLHDFAKTGMSLFQEIFARRY